MVALRKRGEQNVYEFHLDKSKQFQRVGPLSIALFVAQWCGLRTL